MTEHDATRRSFLQHSAAAITAALLSPLTESAASASLLFSPQAAGPAEELLTLSLVEAAELIRNKKISPLELTRAALDRIADLDAKVGAFRTVAADQALAAARIAETEIVQGNYRGPLHGIPVGFKDTNYTQGILTTARSRVLQDFIPAYDATVVRRLKEAGAILIGKTNLPEFSFGGYTPGTQNPWDLSRNAGGSSGGSAAAVAAGMLWGATGGDTSGSIRNPASTCGVVGLKPTFGLVSRYGVIPISWTLDHVGPIARTVEDTAVLLQAMAGYDPQDDFSARLAVPDYRNALRSNIRAMRVGLPPASYMEQIHPESRRATEEASRTLQQLGVQIREIALPPALELARPIQRIVRICEAAAYHRQFLLSKAGQYGFDNATTPQAPDVRTNVEAGSLLTASQYLRCQRLRKVFVQQMLEIFESIDALLTPATSPAFSGQSSTSVSFRPEMNVCGFPAISVPAGFSVNPAGLPIGLQIVARPFQDALVLNLAYAYESATEWHKRRPPL
ncbi:MAG: Asp-tRNA(Asn)/Glu-tRNA(Gln) amidotransferase subunit GatA [Acidobacteria bacterium]|nr:Asp-tRNA(Asn)/Glu-tRNA(Gln) amidotransferase subunit GatA [Acidobacteriota bacterium]